MLVEDQKLDAVIKLPSGVFRPYAGVSTAILLFTKTERRRHRSRLVLRRAGRRLVPRRQAHAAAARGQARAGASASALTEEEHAKNNLPDVLARWTVRDGDGAERPRTAQSFCVPKAEIAGDRATISRSTATRRSSTRGD